MGEKLRAVGVSAGSHLIVGVIDAAAGAALLVPRLTFHAAVVLMIVMTGAAGTHLLHGEMRRLIAPLVYFVMLGVVAWLRRRRRPAPPTACSSRVRSGWTMDTRSSCLPASVGRRAAAQVRVCRSSSNIVEHPQFTEVLRGLSLPKKLWMPLELRVQSLPLTLNRTSIGGAMNGINWSRVIVGGLLAGLVMNVGEAALHGGVLAADAEHLYARYELSIVPSPVPIVSLIGTTFVLGIASVWLYAAIRPRYGAGARTAIIAGLGVWVMAHLWSGIYLGMGFQDLIPRKLALLPVVWGLVEAPLATVAGAWLYREAEPGR